MSAVNSDFQAPLHLSLESQVPAKDRTPNNLRPSAMTGYIARGKVEDGGGAVIELVTPLGHIERTLWMRLVDGLLRGNYESAESYQKAILDASHTVGEGIMDREMIGRRVLLEAV